MGRNSLLGFFRGALTGVVVPAVKLYAEYVILGPVPGPRWLARRVLARWLLPIEPLVNKDFYLSQLERDFMHSCAARDPALHYFFVGRFKDYAPNPDFDPIFYRANNPDLGWASDPLMHFAGRSPSHLIPTNEGQSVLPLPANENGRPALLTLHHGRGGGSSRYLQLYEQHLCAQGYEIFRVERVARARPLFRVLNRQSGLPLGKVFDLITDEKYFLQLCGDLRISRLVVSHVVDLPPSITSLIPYLCRAARIPFDIIVHDYLLICPRINLVDGSGRYCGEPAVDQCRKCIQESGSDFAVDDPAVWRQDAEKFVRAADRVFAPSDDVVRRLTRYWPGRNITVWQPENEQEFPHPHSPSLSQSDFLRIAIIGSLNVVKGYRVVLEQARRVAEHRLPLKFILIGESINDTLLRRLGMTVHGRYRDADLAAILQSHSPHIVFHPAICPETWSFVVSAALKQAIPVYAFDIGAIADRLRKLGLQTVLPLSFANEPDELAKHFMSVRSRAIVGNEQIGQHAVVGDY